MPKGRDAGAEKTKSWYRIHGRDRFLTPVVYFEVDDRYLNGFDKIARLLMAVIWSSQFDPTEFLQQNLVGQGTLAVASSAKILYVAANDCFPPNATWNGLRQDLGSALYKNNVFYDNLFFLANPKGDDDRSFHAEAQMVQFFHKNMIAPDSNLIGVSKPCCHTCAEMLDRVGLFYSYWHDEKPPGWIDPNVAADSFLEKPHMF